MGNDGVAGGDQRRETPAVLARVDHWRRPGPVGGKTHATRDVVDRVEVTHRPLIGQHPGEAHDAVNSRRSQRVGQCGCTDELDRGVDSVGDDRAHLPGQIASSMSTWSTPMSVRAAALPGLRVVDSTIISRCLARTAVAIPTEEVPPLIRMDCPGWASRPIVREPYDVWSISGSAPRVAQSRSLRNAMTWAAGTQVYSA